MEKIHFHIKKNTSHLNIFEHVFLNPLLYVKKIIRVWTITYTSFLYELLNVLYGEDKQNAENISTFSVVSVSFS